MAILFAIGVALLGAVLVSELASRSVLSTASLFLVVGFAVAALGWVDLAERDALVLEAAEAALVVTLFQDGIKTSAGELRRTWSLPGRALLFGLPLTLLATAALGHWVAGLRWPAALLVGAVLAPSDPVFSAALIGSEHVPQRLRRLLNVESGLNDGLTAPIVLVLIGVAGGAATTVPAALLSVAIGVAIGVAVPFVAVWLYRRGPFAAAPKFKPMFAVAVLLVSSSGARLVHGNELLAAFTSGVVLATTSEKAKRHYEVLGENATELVKLGALFVFGASMSIRFFSDIGWRGYAFVVAALILPRPLAIAAALGGRLAWRETLAAGWFGPKGFASVLFGLLVLKSSVPDRDQVFALLAVVIAASMVVHSTTAHFAVRSFQRAAEAAA